MHISNSDISSKTRILCPTVNLTSPFAQPVGISNLILSKTCSSRSLPILVLPSTWRIQIKTLEPSLTPHFLSLSIIPTKPASSLVFPPKYIFNPLSSPQPKLSPSPHWIPQMASKMPCLTLILSCYSKQRVIFKNGTSDHVTSLLKIFSGFSLHLE